MSKSNQSKRKQNAGSQKRPAPTNNLPRPETPKEALERWDRQGKLRKPHPHQTHALAPAPQSAGIAKGESAKDFLKRHDAGIRARKAAKKSGATEQERNLQVQAEITLLGLKGAKAFYYPACGTDWEFPLGEFQEKCDTFIFCDWPWAHNEHEADGNMRHLGWLVPGYSFRENLVCNHSCPLDCNFVEKLDDMTGSLAKFFGGPNTGMRSELCEYLGQRKEPWARYAELVLTLPNGLIKPVNF
ncbi:MAG: hypothetical protein L0387_06895, partial [Acidobacteria bacterium]|nr:hypothetical protein [Acidobacteriota bacterium]